MTNQEVAKIFYEIASFLEMQDIAFKPQAYEKAALNLETLSENIEDIYKKGGLKALKEIPGIGQNMAEKIIEYIKTGKIREHQNLKKKMPVNIEELTAVEGIGPKMVRDLYKYLKIKNLDDLEKAAKAGKIRNLPNFGLKTEQNILEGIEFLKRNKGRFLLGEILPRVYEIIDKLKNLKEVRKISEAGSVRRRKETIGDVDILIIVDEIKKPASAKASAFGRRSRLRPTKSADRVIDYFISLPDVVKVWGKGPTKASVRVEQGFDIDLRILPERSFGSALQYFTGSKEHNIVLRKIALDKGLKLNEYGLFKGPKMIAGKTEEEIYQALKMAYIEPELRENAGEIEAALLEFKGQAGGLPKIIDYNDILGDLHVHCNWDGGENSIEEITRAALKKGYQYVGIADHTKFLKIEHGLDEKQLLQRNKEIDKLNEKFKSQNSKFRILKSCEANILNDGSIDIADEVLKKMDFVIAGVHSNLKMPKEKMTERVIQAMKNPNIDVISHPTGRILKRRDEYEIDFDKILKAAKETGTVLEINSYPQRLDLKDINIKKAKEIGVKMVINTDSHHIDELRFIEFGVFQARRGWARRSDIINAWPLEKMKSFLKK